MQVVIKAVFTLHRIAFAPPRKSYQMGLQLTQERLWRRCFCDEAKLRRAAPISIVERHISDRFWATLRCSMNTYSAEVNK